MAGRSSTRHKREVQGLDSQGYTAPDFDETNDFVAKLVTPKESGGVLPSRTQGDHDGDGNPSVAAAGGGGSGGGSGSGGDKPCD
jgi:hypothetical protein